jgi:hypothetical protein
MLRPKWYFSSVAALYIAGCGSADSGSMTEGNGSVATVSQSLQSKTSGSESRSASSPVAKAAVATNATPAAAAAAHAAPLAPAANNAPAPANRHANVSNVVDRTSSAGAN